MPPQLDEQQGQVLWLAGDTSALGVRLGTGRANGWEGDNRYGDMLTLGGIWVLGWMV